MRATFASFGALFWSCLAVTTQLVVVGAQNTDIFGALVGSGLDNFVAAVSLVGLRNRLQDTNADYTVFAPTDEAFENLPPGYFNYLFGFGVEADAVAFLSQLLLYHVVTRPILTSEVASGQRFPTFRGTAITISESNGDFYVNSAKIVTPDIVTNNGVVHIIDSEFLCVPQQFPPPSAPAWSNRSDILLLLILLWPRLPEVLFFPGIEKFVPSALKPSQDIVDTATSLGLNSLIFLANQANLVPTLRNPNGQYTVFAPSEGAFSALGGATVNFLVSTVEGRDELARILSYHILPTPVYSNGLKDGFVPTTLEGSQVEIRIAGGNTFVNQARIISADFLSTNGVVHIIDSKYDTLFG